MQVIFAGGLRGQIEGRLRQWANASVGSSLLVPLRNLAWLTVRVRNALRPLPTVRVSVPVISVGNITVGGTGKTPLTMWLVKKLVEAGHKPAILTPLGEKGDETEEHLSVFKSTAPLVFAGRDRAENAKRAVALGATVIVLDDGFQYRRLHRDVDIVLWDATFPPHRNNPFLREPLSQLKRADCIVMSKADFLSDERRNELRTNLEKLAGEGKVVAAFGYEPVSLQSPDGTVEVLENLRRRKVLLVAGIGNPSYFAWTAQRVGFEVVEMICFPDHFRYKQADAQFIAERAKLAEVDAVLTTPKDAVKLRDFWSSDVPLFSMQVKLRWLWGEESLWEIVEGCVKNAQAKFEVKP